MAVKRPVFTENFSANLAAIEVFLEPDGRTAFDRLLSTLLDETIPTLCRFLESGRAFLNRAIKSTKAEELVQRLRRLIKKDDMLRECLMDDHLVLYLVRQNTIVFLAIKHHRQLSFDLKHFWQEE